MLKPAWIGLLIVEGIFLLFGIGDVIMGVDADPAIVESIAGEEWKNIQVNHPPLASILDLYVRSQGFTIAMLSVLSILVTVSAFRHGKKWAWFALWIWPIWMSSIFIEFLLADRHQEFAAPPPMISAPVFFAVTSLALILSFRNFFPRVES